MISYDELRRRHSTEAAARLPGFAERLTWSPDRLRAQRDMDLRRLLRNAAANAPWHRARLAHLDLERVTVADLAHVPPMTKDDLMSNFDAIVTDPRVTLGGAERHLATLERDAYFLDEFHVLASGGSSGQRGVFVYGWDAWTVCFAAYARYMMHALGRLLTDGDAAAPRATVAAARASHMTGAIRQTFHDPMDHSFPVTLPLDEIVAGLNDLRPAILTGYASALLLLAHEARAGRLRITPRLIVSTAEPLLPESRAALEEVWHSPVINVWGTTEAGVTAIGCGAATGMHVNEDMLVLEPVDADGRAVASGERSARVYLTNLINPVTPLIRYEITDEIVMLDEPCPCGLPFGRVADILGRLDDAFTYAGGQRVHPHVFRSALGRESGVVEYQVQQTRRGAAVAIRVAAPVDLAGLQGHLEAELARHGLRQPEVVVRTVDGFERTAVGKIRRFVPLPGA